jgi:hypothetical protein
MASDNSRERGDTKPPPHREPFLDFVERPEFHELTELLSKKSPFILEELI